MDLLLSQKKQQQQQIISKIQSKWNEMEFVATNLMMANNFKQKLWKKINLKIQHKKTVNAYRKKKLNINHKLKK